MGMSTYVSCLGDVDGSSTGTVLAFQQYHANSPTVLDMVDQLQFAAEGPLFGQSQPPDGYMGVIQSILSLPNLAADTGQGLLRASGIEAFRRGNYNSGTFLSPHRDCVVKICNLRQDDRYGQYLMTALFMSEQNAHFVRPLGFLLTRDFIVGLLEPLEAFRNRAQHEQVTRDFTALEGLQSPHGQPYTPVPASYVAWRHLAGYYPLDARADNHLARPERDQQIPVFHDPFYPERTGISLHAHLERCLEG